MKITLDNLKPEMVDAAADGCGYQPQIQQATPPSQVPNPQTRTDFLEERLRAYIRETATGHRANDAARKAKRDAEAEFDKP